MSLDEKITACKQAYQDAKEKMPRGTKAIVLLSNIKQLNCRERRAFEDAIESLIENVEEWVCTFTLFGQTGFYSHCAINPHTITDAALENVLCNLLVEPEKLKIEYYR